MHTPKLLLLSLALSTSLSAQDIKVVGTLEQRLNATHAINHKPTTTQHSIKLLKVELSKPALGALNKRTNLALHQINKLPTPSPYPSKVQLGMNNVPVLDQGTYGTCVTFATTAALNAAMNESDYISQLCQLQLGNYLEANGYNTSGWDGTLGRFALSQIDSFGIISKANQATAGCGGLKAYPENDNPIPTNQMSIEEFHKLSESLENKVFWSPLLDIYTAMDRIDTNKTLNDIKQSLNEKDRVTFGVLLLDFDLGTAGAVGTYNANYDAWVLTPEIARDIYLRPNFGGHEMIITGYDDDAVATDDQGRQHKGLLTLRNSWGDELGDQGNFYMSYDYFKVLVIEAQRIRSMPADGGVDSARG